MRTADTKPRACEDCVEVHGDDPAEWLRKWGGCAEARDYLAGSPVLCDGCADERVEAGDSLAADDRERGIDWSDRRTWS